MYDCGISFGDGLWHNLKLQNEFPPGNQDVMDTVFNI